MDTENRERAIGWAPLVLGTVSVVLALCLLAATAGCSPADVATPASTTTTTISTSTPAPAVTAILPPTGTVPVSASSIITLTVWTIPVFAPGETTGAARLLQEQSDLFSEAHPDYRLDWVVKPAVGSGNLRDFLLAAQDVAPAIAPDMVVLDLQDLGDLTRAGLLQPVDDFISEEMRSDLFPFARNAVVIDGQWYGIPIAADIEHVIYDSAAVDAPPLTWSDVLSDTISYAFPAGGQGGQVNEAFLIQYLALGGRLYDNEGLPTLDRDPLAEVLSFYADGVREGLFAPGLLDIQTTEDALGVYLSGEVDMSNIQSDIYLSNREKFRNSAFATIPTWNGTVATVGHGLAFSLITTDPNRQIGAKALSDWMVLSDQLSDWIRVAGHLPARRSVLDLWGTEDNYYTFARWQLASAYFTPSTPVFNGIYESLQQAVRDVIRGASDPTTAADRVVAFVQGKG